MFILCCACILIPTPTPAAGGVFEQVIVTSNWPDGVSAPLGSRFRLIVPKQKSKSGEISASQFLTGMCAVNGQGGYWLQIGYMSQPGINSAAQTAFGWVFPIAPTPGTQVYSVGAVLAPGEHEFAMLAAGGGFWDFYADGVKFWSFLAGCDSIPNPNNAQDVYEQYDPTSTRLQRLQDVTFTNAFEFFMDGIWVSGAQAMATRSSFICKDFACSFDAHGAFQEPELSLNQIRYSGRYEFSRAGFRLW